MVLLNMIDSSMCTVNSFPEQCFKRFCIIKLKSQFCQELSFYSVFSMSWRFRSLLVHGKFESFFNGNKHYKNFYNYMQIQLTFVSNTKNKTVCMSLDVTVICRQIDIQDDTLHYA